ncbi:aldehyde dehydrogenase [Sinorhizobium americanum]|uniref:Gamma-glutamyl-gamma-aminobutyraldehyde dehydrogenase n=1 Tax=Sinorhizobium americanum TaxID=194963 RepID=A0A4R2BR33_9HYPH|nr:aldehyde dehydrogenase [Sinorhizobium americanum]TCN28469.1 gamma-glutamyl-gamma-aminobutyraldehyde dehydrogenase [Sinorhizobium americanum]
MHDLLTAAEYAAIAKSMSYLSNAFVDGAFRPAASGKTFKTTNPATGEVLTEIAACDSSDVDFAVAKAKQAFEDGRWHLRSPGERKDVLLKFARLLERNRHELAVLESLDSGKPIREVQTIDVPDTIHTIRWHAELIDKIYDNTAPVGSNALTLVVREPIGVVGLVLPWNFPLLMLAWKIGPALAAGCSVVVKPAQETTLTALRVAELAHEAGIPAGVFNVVTGSGKDVGEPLGMHMDVSMVSFTGSTATGRRFLRYAADSNLKRVVLECGGKNPAVVMNDVEDLDLVAEQVVNGAFWNMGENCSATSRLIVHADVKDELLKRIGAYMREWRMGDPLNPENRIGSLVSKAHFEKVKSFLDDVQTEKLSLLFGGDTREGGNFVEPTVVDGVGRDSRLFQEEIFGPVLSVTTFSSLAEAITLANDTVYGLTASVYTGSLRNAIKLSREIRAGVVTVNCFGEGDATTPFGGYKESGFGGRDKSIWAHDQYTELKTIWIDVSDRSVDETVR